MIPAKSEKPAEVQRKVDPHEPQDPDGFIVGNRTDLPDEPQEPDFYIVGVNLGQASKDLE